ncbi:MAG: hypothetical protein ABR532_08955 [Candidatus Dormibacteria bacterium]
MTISGPRFPILAPPLVPPGICLVNCAYAPDAAERAAIGNRWGLGMEFRSLWGTGSAEARDVCAPEAKSEGENPSDLVDVDPFAVVVDDSCSTFGFTYGDYQARALQKHKARESFIIAEQFWTGALSPSTFHLAYGGNVTDINGGTALAPPDAIDLMDQSLGQCLLGANGMIFCTPRVFLATFLSAGLYRPNNGRMVFTHMDTPVVPDYGFPGTAPDGTSADPTVEWMYGTAAAKVYRSQPVVFPTEAQFTSDPNRWQAVARDRNTVTFRAESIAAVVVDPACLLGVKVSLPA